MRIPMALFRIAVLVACGSALLAAPDAQAGRRRDAAPPLAPVAGLPQYQAVGVVSVPGGAVNVMGGNLIVGRTDLSIDTRLGTQTIAAVYNSASGQWTWNFDVTYSGTLFTDSTGAKHDVSGLSDGDAIPGTTWVKVDADEIKSKGGLVHEFDANGRLVVVRWSSSDYPRLEFVQSLHDGLWRPDRIDQCTALGVCAPVFWLWYGGGGALTHVQDRASRDAFFTYGSGGRLATARDGLDVAKGWPGFRYAYVGSSNVLDTITNSEDEVVKFTYGGGSARVIAAAQLGEENPIHRFAYFSKAQGLFKTTYTDPLGFETDFRYDNTRHLEDVTQYLDVTRTQSESTDYVWSGNRVTQLIDPAGVETSWEYSGDDVSVAHLPLPGSTHDVTFTYASNPNAVNRENPHARPLALIWDGSVIQLRLYDADGRLEEIRNGAGDATQLTYDSDEMIASMTNPAGRVTEYEGYGDAGHPTLVRRLPVVCPLCPTQAFKLPYAYDAVGNLTQGLDFSDPSAPGWGGVISRSFDEDRNVVEVMLDGAESLGPIGDPRPLNITYRSDGRPDRIDRPFDGDTTFAYDAIGRLLTRSDKASGSWHPTGFEYDPLGRTTSILQANGMRQQWTYDALGRVAARTISGGAAPPSSAIYSYQNGRLTSIDDDVSGVESYTYDEAGRVSWIAFPGGESLQILYDARSRVTGNVYWMSGLLRHIQYGYDGADRQTLVRDVARGVDLIQKTYTGGRLEQVDYQNGDTIRTMIYEDQGGTAGDSHTTHLGNPVEDTVRSPGACGGPGALALCHEYTTDTYGTAAAQTMEFHWLAPSPDGATPMGPRDTYVVSEGPSGSAGTVVPFDQLSNLGPPASTAFEYNSERNRLNAITETSGGTLLLWAPHTYTYDDAGFVIDRDGLVLGWDGAGRIASIGPLASFLWDAQDRLASSWILGVETKRLFGGRVEATSSNVPLALDLGEVRIDLTAPQSSPSEYLYRHYDFRGNVKFTTDKDGDVIAHYQYGAFGVLDVIGSPGSFEADQSFAQGRSYEGLVLLGSRLLDSHAGRFLAPDPVYQLINQHAYAMGNPVWFWDPGGRLPRAVGNAILGLGAIVGGLAGGAIGTSVAPGVGTAVGMALGAVEGLAAANMIVQMLGGRGRSGPGAFLDPFVIEQNPEPTPFQNFRSGGPGDLRSPSSVRLGGQGINSGLGCAQAPTTLGAGLNVPWALLTLISLQLLLALWVLNRGRGPRRAPR